MKSLARLDSVVASAKSASSGPAERPLQSRERSVGGSPFRAASSRPAGPPVSPEEDHRCREQGQRHPARTIDPQGHEHGTQASDDSRCGENPISIPNVCDISGRQGNGHLNYAANALYVSNYCLGLEEQENENRKDIAPAHGAGSRVENRVEKRQANHV